MNDLETALSRIEGIRITPAAPGAVAYGIVDDPGARINELLETLWRRVANYADIETARARTTVSWTGDFSTAVNPAATPQNLQIHALQVGQTLTRRSTYLRIVTAATALAAAVTAATANPIAIPAAFRAGWKLVAELERIQ